MPKTVNSFKGAIEDVKHTLSKLTADMQSALDDYDEIEDLNDDQQSAKDELEEAQLHVDDAYTEIDDISI